MVDDPIKAPPFSPRKDREQANVMTIALDAILPVFPGAVVTLMVSYPESFPGLTSKTPGSRTNYISNGQREDMAAAMLELLRRWGKL